MKMRFLLIVLVFVMFMSACGNSGGETPKRSPFAPEPTEVPEDIDPGIVDIIGTVWNVTELSFDGSEDNGDTKKGHTVMDVRFTQKESGTLLVIPSFWDGNTNYKVRFAPTECGIWEYETVCESDPALNGIRGTIGVNAYKGDLAIYQHGFVKAVPGVKYFMYNDGTPFFYLGDTHWNMYAEEMDRGGSHAGDIETDSHFKYLVDKRVEQGFTVYQSEPIDAPFASISSGDISKTAVAGFKKADEYYQYIAEKGLVHANAEFFFTGYMTESLANDDVALERLSRYWVARFGAYPVIWTLAQECDNDFYYERGDQKIYDAESNPWVKIAKYIHKYDAYSHPLSAHQENVVYTTASGRGTDPATGRDNGGMSVFYRLSASEYGHNFWAAQWSPSINCQYYMEVPKDYWESDKVGINYEGRYAYLWTKDFGSRAQGWISYLSGMYGYGYGAADIWLYKSTYDMDSDAYDGIDTITAEDKKMFWSESVGIPSAYQVGYMKSFFERFEWWNLTPDFDSGEHFTPASGAFCAVASDGNSRIVIYLYNQSTAGGTVKGLSKSSSYTVTWFNPRTGEYSASKNIKGKTSYSFSKPDEGDWVLEIVS